MTSKPLIAQAPETIPVMQQITFGDASQRVNQRSGAHQFQDFVCAIRLNLHNLLRNFTIVSVNMIISTPLQHFPSPSLSCRARNLCPMTLRNRRRRQPHA